MIAPQRFWDKVTKTDDCWIWTAAVNRKGYGIWNPSGTGSTLAYKWLWESINGPVPKDLVLDHYRCDNARCVRPDHLRPVTSRENVLRGGTLQAMNLAKRHCPGCGGPYSDVFGGRRCAPCRKKYLNEYHQRRKAM